MIVDMYSDMVCPWCRIGKKNVQDALSMWDGEPVTVRFRSFILDAGVPKEGDNFRERMIERKGLPEEQVRRAFENVTEAGKATGLHFDFERVTIAPNTTAAHCLMAIAPEPLRSALLDQIMEAYFLRNVNIGLPEQLGTIAEKLGIEDAESIARRLRNNEGLLQVKRDLREARTVGVTGVPYFVFNEKYGLSGARPPKDFIRALEWTAKQGSALET